jgi:hypothetical protein
MIIGTKNNSLVAVEAIKQCGDGLGTLLKRFADKSTINAHLITHEVHFLTDSVAKSKSHLFLASPGAVVLVHAVVSINAAAINLNPNQEIFIDHLGKKVYERLSATKLNYTSQGGQKANRGVRVRINNKLIYFLRELPGQYEVFANVFALLV